MVGTSATFNDWLVPIDLTYEIDVWGCVRRGLESARAQAVASADDEAAVRLTVQTDVAQFYYTLRLLDEQTEILTRTVASFEEQVRVLSVQVRTGLASPIVLSQAEALLQSRWPSTAKCAGARRPGTCPGGSLRAARVDVLGRGRPAPRDVAARSAGRAPDHAADAASGRRLGGTSGGGRQRRDRRRDGGVFSTVLR